MKYFPQKIGRDVSCRLWPLHEMWNLDMWVWCVIGGGEWGKAKKEKKYRKELSETAKGLTWDAGTCKSFSFGVWSWSNSSSSSDWRRAIVSYWQKWSSNPAEVGSILSWRLIMKYFLRSFSPFCWFKKGSCQFLAKECAQYWLTAKRTKPTQ